MITANRYQELYLSHPCFKLGSERSIDKGLGWEAKYSQSESKLLDLAVSTGRRTTQSAGFPISRILLCTESHWDLHELDASRIAALKEELGLQNAHISLLGLNYCNNFHNVIDMASALINNDGSNVLVILADICKPGETRTVGASIGVLSDGASSFILTKEEPASGPCYKVESCAFFSDSSLTISEENESYIETKANDIGRLINIIEELKEAVHGLPSNRAADYFVTCNFRPEVIELYATLLGSVAPAYNATLSRRYSHVFSSDVVISLSHLFEQSTAQQTVLSFTNGPHSWGMSVMRRI